MKFKDYYELMGVSRDATQEEIKRAYRKLARRYHPDVSKEADAEDRFKEIGEAYEVLKDPEKRAAYDELGQRGYEAGQEFRPPPDWQFDFDPADRSSGFSDFFEQMFGGTRGATGTRGRSAKGFDSTAQIDVGLDEAFQGATRSISLNRVEPGNDGRPVTRRQELSVKIPAGVTDGQQIRLAGQGEPGFAAGPRGDLYLQVRLRPHPFFRVEGKDIWLDLPVAPWEAALGGSVRVPTLSGPVDMTIPKGSSSGQRLRLKGRGLPGKPSGDQNVVLKIVLPAADTPEREKLYRDMQQSMPFNPRQSLES